jgi:hypothetical protein
MADFIVVVTSSASIVHEYYFQGDAQIDCPLFEAPSASRRR